MHHVSKCSIEQDFCTLTNPSRLLYNFVGSLVLHLQMLCFVNGFMSRVSFGVNECLCVYMCVYVFGRWVYVTSLQICC